MQAKMKSMGFQCDEIRRGTEVVKEMPAFLINHVYGPEELYT